MAECNIWWIRKDIRLQDNQVLIRAAEDGNPVFPFYLFDPSEFIGGGQKKKVNFIFQQLANLNNQLANFGTALTVCYGKARDVFAWLKTQFTNARIFTSVQLGHFARQTIQEAEKFFCVEKVLEGYLLNFDKIRSKSGTILATYFHFKNAAYKELEKFYVIPVEVPKINWFNVSRACVYKIGPQRIEKLDFSLDSLGFEVIELVHEGAVRSAEELLERFEKVLPDYQRLRDFPAANGTSLLSAHLCYGTISIRKVFKWAADQLNSAKFLEELLWREFFSYLLYHFPESEFQDFRKDYNTKWLKPSYEDWKKVLNARIGIPIVDAGLKQLYLEGFVHNRIRMIIASYFTKDLGWDWRFGERLFAEHLIDYDPALNVGNWQWNAGVGVDPRSKYRRFNPQLQAQKFDPEGYYVSRYLERSDPG